MALYNLLTLKLSSPLSYRRAELPAVDYACCGAIAEAGIPADNGGETVFIYPSGSLVRFDEAEGPRILAAPASPVDFGVSDLAGACPGESIVLDAGLYAFMQWRASDGASLAEGVEFFARETWWENMKCAEPWILRRVAEDGKIATQLLARLDQQQPIGRQ